VDKGTTGPHKATGPPKMKQGPMDCAAHLLTIGGLPSWPLASSDPFSEAAHGGDCRADGNLISVNY